MENREKRTYLGSIEIETRDGEETRTITGYAVVFDKPSHVMGRGSWAFQETIARTAFEGVDMSKVVATFNHNFDNILARADSNTLNLTIDDFGLKYTFESPNTTAGNDLLENVRNGNIKGSSFMFSVKEQKWTYKEDENDPDLREVTKVDELIELGPVTMPAYPDTSAAKRSHEENKPQQKVDVEDLQYKAKALRKKNAINNEHK
jgi:HK97 family phage prohead protease